LSRLSAVNDARLGRTDYAYDPAGNLAGYALPNGVTTTHAYDALNRLTNLTATVGSVGVAQYVYTLSPAGHRLSAAETVVRAGTPQTIDRLFSYDATYRLLGETISGSAGSASAGYTYDAVGNRLTRTTSGFAPGTLDNQSFAFDPNDRLHTDTYDANGNTLFGAGFSQTQADRYDFENRLLERRSTIASVTRTVNLAYDGDGNRVSKTVNGVTTFYLVDDLNPTGYAQVLEELAVAGAQLVPIRLYTHGHDLLSQDQLLDTGTNLVWSASFHGYDGHGSVRYLTDLNGDVTDTYDYDAFGNLIAQTGTTPNLYLYSGEQFDPDLGLYYLRARYHNPQTGRFWSTDSFEGFGQDPASLHKYTYCANNPINCVDPSGRFSVAESTFTMAYGLVARTLGSAMLGASFGAIAGGLDAIAHGRVSQQELAQAVRAGASAGFDAGLMFGALGAVGGPVGALGSLFLRGVYLAPGFYGVLEDLQQGDYEGAEFRARMVAAGTILNAYTLRGVLTESHLNGANLGAASLRANSVGRGILV
jgi:RHS repeat-associated protein